MVTRTGRYALRVLGFLAEHEGARIQGREIARRTGIPPNYLSKILHQLSRRGWVSGRKGWGGGFLLEPRARRVPIQKVLELVEGRRQPGGCVFGLGDCDGRDPCPLHPHWERIRGAYDEMLRSVTVADLRTGRSG